MSFTFSRWHSINLIPHASAVSTVDDDDVYGRQYQLTIFSFVFSIHIKPIKKKRAWLSSDYIPLGPMYSRDKKRWYNF